MLLESSTVKDLMFIIFFDKSDFDMGENFEIFGLEDLQDNAKCFNIM